MDKPSFFHLDDVTLRMGHQGRAGDRAGGRDQPGGLPLGAAERVSVAHVPELHEDQGAWKRQLRRAPTRVQWEPERDLRLSHLPYRSLQLGLSGEAAARYADEWVVGIEDDTPLAAEVHGLVRAGELGGAAGLLPVELPYPLDEDVLAHLRP